MPTVYLHTALIPAIYNGDLAIVKELIALDSNLNQCVYTGHRSLVYTAARYKRLDVLKYLLSLNLHPDFSPETGHPPFDYTSDYYVNIQLTPLTSAIKNNDLEAVQILLNAGADPNRASRGIPPLHFASAGASFPSSETLDYNSIIVSYRSIVDALLAAGANIDAVSETGETFLMKTIQNRETEVALHLIEAGADVNIPDKDGLYPIDYACANNQVEILRTLLQVRTKLTASSEIMKEVLRIREDNI